MTRHDQDAWRLRERATHATAPDVGMNLHEKEGKHARRKGNGDNDKSQDRTGELMTKIGNALITTSDTSTNLKQF